MSDTTPSNIQKQIKFYVVIFAGLIVMTLVNAGLSQVESMSHTAKTVLILLIATFQATLSLFYFMHLNAEKKSIWWFLILTAAFFAVLIFLPLFTLLDHAHF